MNYIINFESNLNHNNVTMLLSLQKIIAQIQGEIVLLFATSI